MATLITLPNTTVVKKRNVFAPLGQRSEDSQAGHGVSSRVSPVLGLVLWVLISPAAFVDMQAGINTSWDRVAG